LRVLLTQQTVPDHRPLAYALFNIATDKGLAGPQNAPAALLPQALPEAFWNLLALNENSPQAIERPECFRRWIVRRNDKFNNHPLTCAITAALALIA
jgi:hypothetical protein